MRGRPGWYRWEGDTLVLELRVQPRARTDAVIGVQGERLKLCISAPPVEGEANACLIRFLAKLFKVTQAQVTLQRGAHGRDKRVRIHAPRVAPDAVVSQPGNVK